ncbi:MAG: SDR family NAD(P)-dependent oxidoreductase [bacterium]|nr:SDR family NAD(P)-dependent oxidoreductase [bacterium]
MNTLRDKVIVITGAGGSIAGAVAEAFREAGARPALIDRDLVRIQGCAASCGTIAVESDLASTAAVEYAVDAVLERHGHIDGLVHLVGDRVGGPVGAIDEATFDRVFDTNVRTLFLTTKAVLPHLVARGEGFIGGIASKGAWVGGVAGGADGAAVFAAAKSAAAAYLHALDDELRGTGVHVSICFPMGVVGTEQNRRHLGREAAAALIEPRVIGQAFVSAALSGSGGRILELPVHPPG